MYFIYASHNTSEQDAPGAVKMDPNFENTKLNEPQVGTSVPTVN